VADNPTPGRARIDDVASCALNPATRTSLTAGLLWWRAVSKEVGSAFSTNRAAFGLP